MDAGGLIATVSGFSLLGEFGLEFKSTHGGLIILSKIYSS